MNNSPPPVPAAADQLQRNASDLFSKMIGSWKTSFSCEGLPAPLEGTAEIEWVVEGTSILQTVESNMFGTTVRSVRLMAYNPLRRLISAVSLEGAGAGFATGAGPVPPPGTPLHMISRLDEPQTGQLDVCAESVHTIIDKNTHRLEIYQPGPTGRASVGTLTLTRVASGS